MFHPKSNSNIIELSLYSPTFSALYPGAKDDLKALLAPKVEQQVEFADESLFLQANKETVTDKLKEWVKQIYGACPVKSTIQSCVILMGSRGCGKTYYAQHLLAPHFAIQELDAMTYTPEEYRKEVMGRLTLDLHAINKTKTRQDFKSIQETKENQTKSINTQKPCLLYLYNFIEQEPQLLNDVLAYASLSTTTPKPVYILIECLDTEAFVSHFKIKTRDMVRQNEWGPQKTLGLKKQKKTVSLASIKNSFGVLWIQFQISERHVRELYEYRTGGCIDLNSSQAIQIMEKCNLDLRQLDIELNMLDRIAENDKSENKKNDQNDMENHNFIDNGSYQGMIDGIPNQNIETNHVYHHGRGFGLKAIIPSDSTNRFQLIRMLLNRMHWNVEDYKFAQNHISPKSLLEFILQWMEKNYKWLSPQLQSFNLDQISDGFTTKCEIDHFDSHHEFGEMDEICKDVFMASTIQILKSTNLAPNQKGLMREAFKWLSRYIPYIQSKKETSFRENLGFGTTMAV